MALMPPGRDGSASPSYRYAVGWTYNTGLGRPVPRSVSWPGASRESAMVCRTGPTCIAIRSSSLSRRYGVGGQPEPAPCRDLLDRVLERGGRDVMAFVSDDKAVPGGQLRDVVAAGQGLQGDNIDGAAQLGPAAAELPGFDAEELGDPRSPLVRQRLPVHQD